MKAIYDNYFRDYREHIRSAFSEPKQKKLLNKLLEAAHLYNVDEYKKAVEKLVRLKEKCKTPDEHCAVLFFLAMTYGEMGYLGSAIDAYKELLAIDPSRSTAWSNLGLLHRSKGEYAAAVKCFETAIEKKPDNGYAYANLGQAYYRMGEYEKGIAESKKALSLQGGLYQAANCICICAYILGNLEESRKYFQLSITNGGNADDLRAVLEELKKSNYKKEDDFFDK